MKKREENLVLKKRIVDKFVKYYNTQKFYSAISYMMSEDKLEEREKQIFAERDRKLYEVK